LPKIFPSILEKKKSWIFPSIGFVELPIFGRKWKKWTYIIYLKYIKQNTDSETNECFSASWEMFSRNSLECPILNLK
jgi:hypothetical protein